MSQAREAVTEIVPGLNRTVSTIVKGTIVKLKVADGVDCIEPATAATDLLHGVAMEDIAASANGNIAVRGRALVRGGAASTAPAYITADADGEGVATTTDRDSYIGVSATDGADNTLFEVDLIGPGAERSTA